MVGITVKKIKILFYLSLLLTCSVSAKQINFSKQLNSEVDQYIFNYQWLDHNKQTQTLNFQITKPALFEHFRMLKPYQDDHAQKFILHTLKKQLDEKPLNGAQAFFLQQDGKTVVQVKGLDNKKVARAYQKVKIIRKKASEQYYKDNYYQLFTSYDGQSGIKMNHARIANESVADFNFLQEKIAAQVPAKGARELSNYVLGFVQSIPYSTLESRITASGTGFNSPAKLLWENQGDCDSKVTLTASILRTLLPNIGMMIVYIDEHAFMGIAMPAIAGESTLAYQGINYVLAEPTGPALSRLGELSSKAALAINQGRYTAEVIHTQ